MPPSVSRIRKMILILALLLLCGLAIGPLVRAARPDGNSLLVAGVDYVPGEIIAQLSQDYVTVVDSTLLARAQFGIDAIDNFLAGHGVYLLQPFVELGETCATPSCERLKRTFLIRYDDLVDADTFAQALATYPQVEYAEVNRIVRDSYHGLKRYEPPAIAEFEKQWYLDFATKDRADIDAPEAWAVTRGSSGVVVVINDSGAMVDTCFGPFDCVTPTDWKLHGDFRHRWIASEDVNGDQVYNRFDINRVDDDGDSRKDNVIGSNFAPGYAGGTVYEKAWWASVPTDLVLIDPKILGWLCTGSGPQDHGTRVASVAVATVNNADAVGVANLCRVYWVKAQFGVGGNFDQASAALSIRHSALHGAVINMSWGLIEDPTTTPPVVAQQVLKDAISYAANEKGCVLVASVGNQGLSNDIAYPAKDANVLAVGSLDTLVTDAVTLSAYSNYNEDSLHVDVVAPVDEGVWVNRHTVCPSPNCPCWMQEFTANSSFGTSFAAPQAAGIAALILSQFRGMAQDSVRSRIMRSAEYYSEWLLDQAGPYKYGSGKVNAYRAVTEWGRVATNSSHAAEWGGQRAGWPDTLYVSGDLFVEAGDTLILNPGTVIRVAPDPITHNEGTGSDPFRVEIIIRGKLRMGTTGTGPVIFESFTPNAPSSTDWAGIRFEPGSQGHLRNVTIRNAQLAVRTHVPLTIDRCVISQGIEAIQTYANLSVKNSRIHDMVSTGITVLAGTLTATNDTIYDCAYGINQSTTTSTGAITIRDCHLYDFDLRAVNVTSASGGFIMKRSIIEGATDGVVLGYQTAALIDSCTIRNNDLGVLSFLDSSTGIKRSRITGNTSTGVYLVANSATFEADTVSNSAAGLFFHYGGAGTVYGNTRITDNLVGIKCDVASSPTVRNTRITANTDGVAALGGSNPDLGHASGATCDMGLLEGRNSIYANSGFDVINTSTSLTVFAECNWWDGAPSSAKFSGSVDYTPYRDTDPNPLGPVAIGDNPKPDSRDGLPVQYDLAYNHPNPFNPVTTIRFDVPPPGGQVAIYVYDVRGAQVGKVVAGRYDPGIHVATWNGTDDRGEPMASGVYFLRMTADGFRQVRKIVLLK